MQVLKGRFQRRTAHSTKAIQTETLTGVASASFPALRSYAANSSLPISVVQRSSAKRSSLSTGRLVNILIRCSSAA